MRFLFATGERYPPEVHGGAEVSIDELVGALLARGHGCEVVAGLGRGLRRLRYRLWRARTGFARVGRRDAANGYGTVRARRHDVRAALAERLGAFRPDVVLAWNACGPALAADAAAAGARAILWLPDATLRPEAGPVPPGALVAAASRFVAERAERRLGRPVSVLRPLVCRERYRSARRWPEMVTLVNPLPTKGVEVALGVARLLPERAFALAVPRGFPGGARAVRRLARRRARNVRVIGPFLDMREVYARTAVLLVPSQCEDASPRVVLEAHANAIPVVASRVGGIPEIGGDAAVLLPPDAPPSAWAEAVERLLSDEAHREDVARRGLENVARAELRPEEVVESLLRLATAPVGSSRDAARAPVGGA